MWHFRLCRRQHSFFDCSFLRKRRRTEHSAAINTVFHAIFIVALAGCAGAGSNSEGLIASASSSKLELRSAPLAITRATQLIVFPFAASAAAVKLEPRIGTHEDFSNDRKVELAQTTAHNVCVEIATSLAGSGWNAACQPRWIPVTGPNTLIIDGTFTEISEGNRFQRMLIGLGNGRSIVETRVDLYQYLNGRRTELLTFSVHADSGEMPGAVITGPVGVLTGGTAAVMITANVASGGVQTVTSSTSYLAGKTAHQVVARLNNYFSWQGWSVNNRS